VNAERLTLLGWSRAILLQLAHPLVAAGVAEHGTFRSTPVAPVIRLHQTVRAMLSLAFGDAAARERTLDTIRAIHRRVHGVLPVPVGTFPAGTQYSAEDPALLLWVHATLLESIPDIYQRVVAPLTPGELDAFCDESAPTLLALGGEADRAPRTWRALCRYIDEVHRSGILAITQEARDIAHAVLTPRLAGWPLPGGSLHRLITIGLLPESIRQAYGFAWNDARTRRLDRTLRLLRSARRLTPDVLARWSDSGERPH
jgi:uncharacterized protein (DUF2236 family)